MLRISVRLGVAVGALEDAIVARIGMAGRANAARSTVIHIEPGVIERRAQPTGSRVTDSTCVREACGHVIRIVRCLVVALVAPVAIRGQRCVVVVHVAVRTRYAGMSAGQRETCVVVVEGCRAPYGGAVADVALLRESHGDVVRVTGALKVL